MKVPSQHLHHHRDYYHYINYLSSNSGLIALFSSSTTTTTTTIIIILLILLLFAIHAWTKIHEASQMIPGCVRFGLYHRSNLSTRGDGEEENEEEGQGQGQGQGQEARIQALFAYPIKSCRGVELDAAEVTGLGLQYDRLFSFAQRLEKKEKEKKKEEEEEQGKKDPSDNVHKTHHWRFITQRDRPQMALITTEIWIPDPRVQSSDSPEAPPRTIDQINDWSANGGCLIVRFPSPKSLMGFYLYTETITLQLPLNPTSQRAKAKGYTACPLSIWKDSPMSLNINSEINAISFAKLQTFLGISHPFALFRSHQPRTITRGLPKDRPPPPKEVYNLGFADAFPLSLLNLASIRAVNSSLPETSRLKNHLSPLRFRANIYISGPPAFAEDLWKRVLIGHVQQSPAREVEAEVKAEAGEYHIACRTARCTLPNVDPSSGVRDKVEPFSTLKRTRLVVDEGAKPYLSLGISVLPLFERGWLRVGERVDACL